MKPSAAIALLVLTGCGRYANFTLPLQPGDEPNLTYSFTENPGPLLSRGVEHDVLNPSVSGSLMLYSAFDGQTWRTLQTESSDRVKWPAGRTVLAPDSRTWEGSYIAANGTVLTTPSQIWYWYVAGPRELPRIGLARSSDSGRSWQKEPMPVLDPGPYGSWDERGVADPYVIVDGQTFYMYFLGEDRAARQRLGVAHSTDGIHWQKLRANPILELGGSGAFDEKGLGEPAVWSTHGYYWMLYTGRDLGEMRRLGLARSIDGVHWTKLPAVFAGSQSWDSKVICDPTVEVSEDSVVVWFGGGDVARPDENLNGQIGAGILRPVSATVGQ